MFDIKPINRTNEREIQDRLDFLMKPKGSLGKLEDIAKQIAMIQDNPDRIILNKPSITLFIAEHGIAEENISALSNDTMNHMITAINHYGTTIDCLCRSNDIKLNIIDAGIIDKSLTDNTRIQQYRVNSGTKNFSVESAMTMQELGQCITYGSQNVIRIHATGCNIIGFGEVGIGNTTSSSVIMHEITKIPLDICVGNGSADNNSLLKQKIKVIKKSLIKHSSNDNNIFHTLSNYGGFEIVQMVGAMLKAAELGMVIIVDGFISTVAALAAYKINSNVKDYMIFSHKSDESGHIYLLEYMNATPIMDLGLRVGEGTGSALAFPLIKSAITFYNDMVDIRNGGG